MILGQLVQTGRRFCECRSRDFIPRTDTVHTLVCYTVNDRFLARTFNESYPTETHEELRRWMEKVAAVAYIQISRNDNPDQIEFPPPLGHHSGPTLTITAAKPDAIQHATFSIHRLRKPRAVRLVNSNIRPHQSWFARHNHYLDVTDEIENEVVSFNTSSRAENLLVTY